MLKIRFQAKANEQIILVLSSVTGQVVYQAGYKTGSSGRQLQEIPVTGLPEGIYIVKVLLHHEGRLKSGVVKVFIR